MAESPPLNPAPRKRRSRTGKDSRIEIIEAATRLFAERGFEGTAMRDIAKSAGVSLGLVTQFHGTKLELHRAVDAHVLNEFARGMAAIPDQHNFIETGYQSVVEFVSRHELQYRYIRRALVENSPGSDEFFKKYHEMQIEIIKRAKKQGAVAEDIDDQWAALVLIFLSLGPIFCMDQVETIIGKSVFDVGSIETRNAVYGRLLRQGFMQPQIPGGRETE